MAVLELDYMEYATDGAAQAAYVSSHPTSYLSQYPTQDTDHVKATTDEGPNHYPHFTTDPTKSLIGTSTGHSWLSQGGNPASQRFHIDLGSAKVIKRIYYENGHHNGSETDWGAKNFTIWGSNSAGDFADLVYVNDGTWIQITPAQSTFDQHVGANQADPKYITLTNITAYRYYAFKFVDNYGDATYMAVRHIELQTLVDILQCYSEDTIVQQGTYSLKVVAAQTGSENDTLTKSGLSIDLTDKEEIKFWVYALRTGTHIQIQIHDSGGQTSTKDIAIVQSNVWTEITWDISGIANVDKDDIDSIIIKIIEAGAENIFYVDNMYAQDVALGNAVFFGANF